MNGIINIYKDKGYTSHDVTAVLKKMLKCKKIGHAGTLDPDAEGVLVTLIGKATKLSDYLMADEKEYRAEITFGIVTDTYDAAGEIICKKTPDFSESDLKKAISGFIGETEQTPPMYSARKVNGKKLYELARNGIVIEREKRKVIIESITVESFNGFDKAVIYIKCGKGTYIRSLCYDVGETLCCGAHMSGLVRTKSGIFRSENGVKLAELEKMDNKNSVIITMEEALKSYSKIYVSKAAEKILYNGGKIDVKYINCDSVTGDISTVYDYKNNLIGIYDVVKDKELKICYIEPRTMLLK